MGEGRGRARAPLLAPSSSLPLSLQPGSAGPSLRCWTGASQDQRVAHREQLSTSRWVAPCGWREKWDGLGWEVRGGGWAPETEGSQGRSWQLCGPLEKVGSGSPAGVADFYCIDLQGRVTLLAWVWKGQNGTSKHFCGGRLSAQSLRPAWFKAPCSGFDGFSRFLKSAPAEDPLPNLTKLGCSMKVPSMLCSERTCRDCPGKSGVAAFYPCPAHLTGTARWGGICYRPLRN